MIFTSGSTVFATSPDDQVVGAFESTGLPETYAGITRSFLRDIGKVLDQAQADLIIGNINIGDSIYKATGGKGTEAKAWEIKKQFEAACTTAGFEVSDVSCFADGGFMFTVSDPVSGKSVTAQANAVRVTWTSAGGTTMVAKTGIDNRLFLLVAILALATVCASVVI